MRAIPFDTSVECSNTASPVQRPLPELPSEEETRNQLSEMTRDMDPSVDTLQDLEGLEFSAMSLNGVLDAPWLGRLVHTLEAFRARLADLRAAIFS